MTITEVIETIKAFYQGDPGITEETTRDQVLYGQTDKDCTGVVTCIWPSVQVIEEAHALGANLIICHEALFWNHGDHQDWLQENGIQAYEGKKALLDQYGLTVWRCHDYVHSGMPIETGEYKDGIFYGLAKQLGWEGYDISNHPMPTLFEIPEVSGRELASHLIHKLGLDGVRVIGDPETRVRRVKIPFHVFGDANADIIQIDQEDFDAILPMEMVDFTLAEYIKDASLLGQNKVAISAGHFNLEEPGMAYMADYLPAVLGHQVPVHFVKVGDTYGYITK
ncbi:Nif3-like dinuclear metal center hexameric protein [Streptococcus rifensis]